MPLQKLVGNIYSIFVEILLWLVPIAGAIAGAIFGDDAWFAGSASGFLGCIIGLVAGLILDVICFGPAIILMNIRSSLKNIEKK